MTPHQRNLPNPHPLLNIRWRHSLAQSYHELGNLLHVDHIFSIFVVAGLNDLGTAGDLQRLLLLHALLVGRNVPQIRRGQARIRFLDACCERSREIGYKQRGYNLWWKYFQQTRVQCYLPIFSFTRFCVSLISCSIFRNSFTYGP